VSKFCRHGTLAERCPICRVAVEEAARAPVGRGRLVSPPRGERSSSRGMTVRREARTTDDGYRSRLAPGLRSSEDAERLAQEIAFAATRLDALAAAPPGLYAQVAGLEDPEQATWLAFLIALVGPRERGDPFAEIERIRVPWGEPVDLADAERGPRGGRDGARVGETLGAYGRFAERSGDQRTAFTGDPSWNPQQRFERIHERLALPGFQRRARYDMLVALGRLGRYELSAPSLLLTEDDAVMAAGKRVFGIGDRMTIERRSRDLAAQAGAPIEALDLALENWARPERVTQGFPDLEPSDAALAQAQEALGL
jgi:hypothetical protein